MAIPTSTSFTLPAVSLSPHSKTASFPLLSRRSSSKSIVSVVPNSDAASPSLDEVFPIKLETKAASLNGVFPLKLETKAALRLTGVSNGPIKACYGNELIMPDIMTPGGSLDLSYALFRNRIIFVGEPTNHLTAQRVISQLVTLASLDEDADILLYINSPGGSVSSVLAIYDCMSWIKPKVGTVCFGSAASHAALLLAAGEKGMRYSMPNSRVMINQPLGTVEDAEPADARLQIKEAMHTRNKVELMYAAFTGQQRETIQRRIEREYFMSAAEAMDFGIIDGLLDIEY